MLPVGYHLGLSASTGDLADNHDVKMLKLYEVDLVPGQTFNVDVSNFSHFESSLLPICRSNWHSMVCTYMKRAKYLNCIPARSQVN